MIPIVVPPPTSEKRGASGLRAAVEVREVGEHGLGDARAAHRERRLCVRAAAGSASATATAAIVDPDHAPTPFPDLTSRLPARSRLTVFLAVASGRPEASSASTCGAASPGVAASP